MKENKVYSEQTPQKGFYVLTSRAQIIKAADLILNKEYAVAETLLTQLLQDGSDEAALWTLMGKARGFLNQPHEALSAYRRAVELQPNDPECQAGLAWGLLYHGGLEETEQAFLHLDNNPASRILSGYWRLGYGMAKAAAGNKQAALDEFLQAARKTPAFAERAKREADKIDINHPITIWLGKFTSAYSLGTEQKYPDAIACLENMLRKDSADADVWTLLGLMRDKSIQPDAALDAYRKGVELSPEDPDKVLALACGSYRHALPAEAMRVFEELQRHPNVHTLDSYWLVQRGLAEFADNRDDEALASYLIATQEASFLRGVSYFAAILQHAVDVEWEHPTTKVILQLVRDSGIKEEELLRAILSMPPVFISEKQIEKRTKSCEKAITWLEEESGITLKNPLKLKKLFNLGGLFYELEAYPLQKKMTRIIDNLCSPRYYKNSQVKKNAFPHSKRLRLGIAIMRASRAANQVIIKTFSSFLQQLDKKRFETVLFYPDKINGVASPEIAKEILKSVDETIQFETENWVAFQNTFHRAQLDILLHENFGEALFCGFCRFAPLQCNFYDTGLSLGSPQDDYAIVGGKMDATDAVFRFYGEKMAMLSDDIAWGTPDTAVPENVNKIKLGVPEAGKMLFSWQNPSRWRPRDDGIIKALLERNPAAWYIMIDSDGYAVDIIRRWRTVMPDVVGRILTIPIQPYPRLLGMIRETDAILAPPLAPGTMSVTTPLGLGVPVPIFHRRNIYYGGGVSLYERLGLDSLVSCNEHDFIVLVERLMYDIEWRKNVSKKILEKVSHIYDSSQAIEEMQQFLQDAYQRVCEGKCPKHWIKGAFLTDTNRINGENI